MSFSAYSHDLGVAAGTGWCKELSITVLTVNIILLFHKADISQGRVAIMAVKLFWMPRTTQCYQERSPEGPNNFHLENRHEHVWRMSSRNLSIVIPDDAVAGSTQRCSAAGCKPFCPLSNSTGHRWERGGVECRAWCSRSLGVSTDGVGDVGWRWWSSLGKRLNFYICCGGFDRVKLIGKILISNPRGPVGGRARGWRRCSRRNGSRCVTHCWS